MKLYEFFNVPVDKKEENDPLFQEISKEDKEKMANEVFWYIIDHDDLHKEYVMPFIRDIKNDLNSPDFNKDRFTKVFVPMVNKGCRLYHKKMKLKHDPKDLFDQEIKDGLCQGLLDKYIEEIKNDNYMVRDHKL